MTTENKTKHTPGPWSVTRTARRRVYEQNDFEIQADRQVVATLYAQNWRYAGNMDEANARLIAAAPDLLETLIEVRSWIMRGALRLADDLTKKAEEDALALGERIDTSIAKARGEP